MKMLRNINETQRNRDNEEIGMRCGTEEINLWTKNRKSELNYPTWQNGTRQNPKSSKRPIVKWKKGNRISEDKWSDNINWGYAEDKIRIKIVLRRRRNLSNISS